MRFELSNLFCNDYMLMSFTSIYRTMVIVFNFLGFLFYFRLSLFYVNLLTGFALFCFIVLIGFADR